MKAIIYARVSTEDQVEGASLDLQVKACREYCEKKGHVVLSEFREDCSGAELNRPELNRIIEIADSFDVLVVYSVDRFARDIGVHYVLEKELEKQDTGIEFAIGDYSKTPEGQLHKNMTAVIAQYERAQILRRTISGLRARAINGKVTHGQVPPYGYDYKEGYFVINEKQAEVIRNIFDWYVHHKLSSNKIATKLTEMGVPTSHDIHGYEKKYPGWQDPSVLRILKNTVYYGEGSFGDIVIDVPPIITKKLFLLAEKQRMANQHFAKRNTKYDYLLTGRIYCAVCGGMMYGVTKHRTSGTLSRYYRCKGVQRTKNGGEQICYGSVEVTAIEQRVWEYAVDVLTNTQFYLDEQKRRHESGEYRDNAKAIQRNREEVERLESERARLLPLFRSGLFTEEELRQEVTPINERLNRLYQDIAELEERSHTTFFEMPKNEFVMVWKDNLQRLTHDQKKHIIAILNLTVYAIRKGYGKADLWVEGNFEGIELANWL